MKTKIITPKDRAELYEEEQYKIWGVLKHVYDWLNKTHPKYFYRLHPMRGILSVNKKSIFGGRIQTEYVIVNPDLTIELNDKNFLWLAKEIQEKIETIDTSETELEK